MNDTHYKQKFLADLERWIAQQTQITDIALKTARKLSVEDEDAKLAVPRYEGKRDVYQFLQSKMQNYKEGKDFDELPKEIF